MRSVLSELTHSQPQTSGDAEISHIDLIEEEPELAA